MKEKIGFIGLGNLGTPIARNLVESGHEVYVYNRTLSRTQPLADAGALVCKNIKEICDNSKLVFSIVSDDAAITSICKGDGGLIAHLQKESVHISMSTILPQTAAELALAHIQHGQHYLACPVFGRPEAVLQKKLNFVLSGEGPVREKIAVLLQDAGAIGVWDFGDNIYAANTVKLCGNFLIASALEAIGESIQLAEKAGVDAKKMWQMLSQTLFNAPVYQNYSQIILQKNFEPAAFTMKLGAKDLNLVLKLATSVDHTMPLASLIKENMDNLIAAGKAEIDWSAVSNANK
jgi:3-hydroxyisobutyrate dehydrogenase-like beta-hydroxyacid dehydrogenase